jgi:gamma-glutamylcyclotransferase (GGCT)/AIG2-like uncharacterized protein YtfP
VLSDDADAWVRGEVYELPDARRSLELLDEYEGCGPNDPKPHRFERVATEARLDSGEQVRTWIYVFRDSTDGAPRIGSGDWLAGS